MIYLHDLFPLVQLEEALEHGYVRRQAHPSLPLSILNYTERCAYDRAWNEVTRQCRGLIYETSTLRVVSRPFAKFFNHGEPEAPDLDLLAPALVSDKLDGSLGILYRTATNPDFRWSAGYAIATRGSFASEQALHATELLHERYADWVPALDLTYLFEIIYPENRVVLDYGDQDDLVLLAAIVTATGEVLFSPHGWPGPVAEVMPHTSLLHALEAEPRENAEGLVVLFLEGPLAGERVKVKQADYVALHRILTGTNARHVWEWAAVRACCQAIDRLAEGRDRGKLWASFLGIDPARVEELEAVGDGWIDAAGIPDEFYGWVRGVVDACEERANRDVMDAIQSARDAAGITDRRERYDAISRFAALHAETTSLPALVPETMRLASGGGQAELDRILCKAWREATPEPTAPFQRSEAVA